MSKIPMSSDFLGVSGCTVGEKTKPVVYHIKTEWAKYGKILNQLIWCISHDLPCFMNDIFNPDGFLWFFHHQSSPNLPERIEWIG